jgi:hypothetical protein
MDLMEIITLYEDNKFSVVVPTMWRHGDFTSFLSKLVESDSVGEVVIINNETAATPTDAILQHPKIKLHDFKLNILVNPAWNYGVGVSQYSKICVMNDDIDFDTSIFDFLGSRLPVGRFVVYSQSHSELPVESADPIDLVHYDGSTRIWDIGCLMFINKQDWVNIPAGLDFFHGDSWLWDTMMFRYNHNFYIKNLKFSTPHQVTSSTIPNREFVYIERECKIYPVMLEGFKNAF